MLHTKFGSSGQSTDGNIIRRMRCACCVPKATNTHSEQYFLLYSGNKKYANALHVLTSYIHTYIHTYRILLMYA
jgi:hypothetical protein